MRGLDNMMLDLYDNPDLLKKLMEFLMDDFINELGIMEQEHAFSLNNSPDGVNGSGGIGYTSDLPEWDSGQTPYYRDAVAGQNLRRQLVSVQSILTSSCFIISYRSWSVLVL